MSGAPQNTRDPRLIESLIANLVDNAIRHNVPGGHVVVTTSASRDGGSVAVRNTGAPIPPGEVDGLFLPFQRLDADRVHRADGSGLGLAIVEPITTAHGATLTTRALDTGGLDVRVEFPRRRPSRTNASPATPGGTASG